MKILVVFYSMFGHVHKLAQAVAEGASYVNGCEVEVKRVPETLPFHILEQMGALEAQKAIQKIPVASVQDLVNADAIMFGTPSRHGEVPAQMRQFLDAASQIGARGSLIGKPGSIFTSYSVPQGKESSIASLHSTLLDHGMIVVGLPNGFQGQMRVSEASKLSHYGFASYAASGADKGPTATELEGAKFQGKFVAEITRKLLVKTV